MIFGYVRISTPKQNVERQIRNILREYPDAVIYEEIYTGRRFEDRREWEKLMKRVKPGDLIAFDGVSRMSRDAEEGFELYQHLYNTGIDLAFIKHRHIDTAVYKKALAAQIAMTGTLADHILQGINTYLMELAKEQIRLAFEQSEAEVVALRQRTVEGLQTAKNNGKQLGRVEGQKVTTKKSIAAKKDIVRMAKDFGGKFTDTETIEKLGISRNTYYKYKREIFEEIAKEE